MINWLIDWFHDWLIGWLMNAGRVQVFDQEAADRDCSRALLNGETNQNMVPKQVAAFLKINAIWITCKPSFVIFDYRPFFRKFKNSYSKYG